MAVTGWKTPGTCINVVVGGGAWANPANAKSSDDAYAISSIAKLGNSDWLQATDFGFTDGDIPSGATIDGIEVKIEHHGGSTNVNDVELYLRKTGAGKVGDNKASAAKWAISDEEITYGGAADPWGTTWVDTDFKTIFFGVDHLQAFATPNADTAYVDCISIRVYYHVAATTGYKDVLTRFRLTAQSFKDITTRFRVIVQKYLDTATRFRLTVQGYKDIATRFKLTVQGFKDTATRFRLTVQGYKDIATRFKLTVQGFKDTATRFRLTVLGYIDIGTRFRIIVQGFIDVSTRFRIVVQNYVNIATRFALQVQSYRDIATRFKLSVQAYIDVATRFKLIVQGYADAATRFILNIQGFLDIATRFLLYALGYRDINTRFILVGRNCRDTATRFYLAAPSAAWREWMFESDDYVLQGRPQAAHFRL
jgi:hypothetical protein